VVGVDASNKYLAYARDRSPDPRARFVAGDAALLSFPSTSFDVSVSGLALNFIAFECALAEQRRVVRPGGTIGAYVWDYAGQYEFARRFWDAACAIDPRAGAYDPGRKAAICHEENLRGALEMVGCSVIETCVFDESGEFPSRDAYWDAFDVRQGSTFEYLSLLSGEERLRLKSSLLATLNPDGPIKLMVRALAVKGLR
jgi:SAM-dependent methyltransferase